MLGTTTTFVGNYYEVTGSVITKYYNAGETRVAMRVGTNGFYWLVADHLGSTTKVVYPDGELHSQQLYKPWGEQRYGAAGVTSFGFTGQRDSSVAGGIMYYGARWYDESLGRWLSPDSITPDPYNPQSYDRYAYVNNSPTNFIDPTGHFTDDAIQEYLKSTYGDGWLDVWKTWSKDKDWMAILRGAQAGDIISRVWFDANGNAQINNYMFGGVGDQELFGIYDANVESSSDLNTIYETSSGIGVVCKDEELGYKVIGTMGNFGYEIHKVSGLEGDVNWLVYNVGLNLLSSLNKPFGIIFGFGFSLGWGWDQHKHPDTSSMGFKSGDVYLRIRTFFATGVDGVIMEGIRTQWTYIFRGDYYTENKTITPITNPYRPY